MGEIRFHPNVSDLALLVELSGEFDARDLRGLREALGVAGNAPAVVDLSEITFLDLQSTRELALRLQLHAGNLVLRSPSSAVRASVEACGYGSWFGWEGAGDDLAAGLPNRT